MEEEEGGNKITKDSKKEEQKSKANRNGEHTTKTQAQRTAGSDPNSRLLRKEDSNRRGRAG